MSPVLLGFQPWRHSTSSPHPMSFSRSKLHPKRYPWGIILNIISYTCRKGPFLLDTVLRTERDMLHLPQIYSLNSYNARGLFRGVKNPGASPDSSISIKAIEPYFDPWNSSFPKITPRSTSTRTHHPSHRAWVTFACQSLPRQPYEKQNPSETGIAAWQISQISRVSQTPQSDAPTQSSSKPRTLGVRGAELLLPRRTMRAVRKGKSRVAAFKCHASRLQQHKEKIIQAKFVLKRCLWFSSPKKNLCGNYLK